MTEILDRKPFLGSLKKYCERAWNAIWKRANTDRNFDSAPPSPDGQGGAFDASSVFCACLIQRLKYSFGLFRGLAGPRRPSSGLSCAKDTRILARLKDEMSDFRT